MDAFICRTCGVQYAPSEQPPSNCPICEDERQYVGWNGQQWTTLEQLRAEGRVTTNKYVHTPRGIFELKYFFNSRIGSVYGEDQ